MKTRVIQVLIRRSETSNVADVVLAHEVPIIKVCRGHGNVEVTDVDCSKYALQPTEVRPRDELIRLKRKYKGFVIEGQHPVDVAFPDGSRDIELFYEDPSAFDTVGDELDDEAIEDVDQGPEAETPATVPADVDPVTGISPIDRDAVIGRLNELTVPFAKTTPTKHLHELLKRAVETPAA